MPLALIHLNIQLKFGGMASAQEYSVGEKDDDRHLLDMELYTILVYSLDQWK